METVVNNEGRMSLKLRNGSIATLRPYDAFAADAIGDQALQEEGIAFDKAISSLVEAIDGVVMPSFVDDRKAAIKAARDLHLNDYHLILFVAIASYRDGVFDGDVSAPDGSTVHGFCQLLNDEGNPLERFDPPIYPLGSEKNHVWKQAVPELDGEEIEFKFKLLDGHARAAMLDAGAMNQNTELMARNPAWYDKEKGTWIKYMPKAHPPSWAAKIITKEARRVDSPIAFNAEFRHNGKKFQTSLFGCTDFFLQDFT